MNNLLNLKNIFLINKKSITINIIYFLPYFFSKKVYYSPLGTVSPNRAIRSLSTAS